MANTGTLHVVHPDTPEVFISYSHADRRWLDELLVHLKPLRDRDLLDCWSDKEITAGQLWRQHIERALASAKIAVLLVSPAFLASSFIAANELRPLLEAAKQGVLTILWIPVSSSNYRRTEIEKLQAAYPPDKPLDLLRKPERQKALVEISERILLAVSERYEKNSSIESGLVDQRITTPAKRAPDRSEISTVASAVPPRTRFWIWRWTAGTLALVGLLAGLVLLTRTSRPPQSWTTRPLTNFIGLEMSPSWSPDGNFIAYSHAAEGDADIYVRPASGGDPVRLTSSPADELVPRWSPDGRHIAFLSDRGTGTDVYLVPPLGGAERKLVATGIPWPGRTNYTFGALGAQPWSPDGQELLFSRMGPMGQTAVRKVDLRTGRETQVTYPPKADSDNAGSWSFDGRQIVFQRGLGKGHMVSLWVQPATGGGPRPLLQDGYLNVWPAWSADDRRIVFSSTRSGPLNLWDIELASGVLRQVTSGPGHDWHPMVSRTGSLAYVVRRPQEDLYWLTVDGATERRLTSNTSWNRGARVSPAGRKVVYQSDRTGNQDIWLLDLETGVDRQLTDNSSADIAPDWSPDGREIVFLSARDGGEFRFWIMGAEGNHLRLLSKPAMGVPEAVPRWSPDGLAIGYLAASEKGPALWSMDPARGEARPLLFGVESFDWLQDSQHVVYVGSADGGLREVRVADLKTGREALLVEAPALGLAVTRDGHTLAYTSSASPYNQQLYILELTTPATADELPHSMGSPLQVISGQGRSYRGSPAWSPDGSALIYTVFSEAGDLYLIQNYS